MEQWIWPLIIVGLLFIFVEIFFVPGIGLAGVIGCVALLLGIYFMGMSHGAVYAAVSFLGSIVLIAGFFVLFFKSPMSKLLILQDQQKPADQRAENLLEPGSQGYCLTDLRPSGKASFKTEKGELRVDVSTNGSFIESGSEVVVQHVEGNRIFVRQQS